MILVTAKCDNGHEQKIKFINPVEGVKTDDLAWAKTWAGLMDSTSQLYVASPIGTDSVIGKCGICKAQIHCTVSESKTEGRIPEPPSTLDPEDFNDEVAGMKFAAYRKIVDSVPPPVDRSQQCLTDGSPVTPDHRELRPDGQQKGYVVLTAAERAKGFVRPVRNAYVHVGKPPEGEKFEYPIRKRWGQACGRRTEMGRALAERYARDPSFYSGTFCCTCGAHFPLDQFVWEGTTDQVGS
jgi:hypothetical protein